jgi:hypothetical protein
MNHIDFVYENRLTPPIETGSIRGHDSLIGNILHFYGARYVAKPRRDHPYLGLLPVSWKGWFSIPLAGVGLGHCALTMLKPLVGQHQPKTTKAHHISLGGGIGERHTREH